MGPETTKSVQHFISLFGRGQPSVLKNSSIAELEQRWGAEFNLESMRYQEGIKKVSNRILWPYRRGNMGKIDASDYLQRRRSPHKRGIIIGPRKGF
jgi:hypothetical protein